MLKREFEVDHDELGNKRVRVPLSMMDAKAQPVLHKPGMLGEAEAPEVTKAYSQAETQMENAWKHGANRATVPTVPALTGDPYQDAEHWLTNAWKEGK